MKLRTTHPDHRPPLPHLIVLLLGAASGLVLLAALVAFIIGIATDSPWLSVLGIACAFIALILVARWERAQ